MTDDTAKDLAACLAHARRCVDALPIDEEAERMVSEMLRRSRPAGYVSRKLAPRRTAP